jgi:hypothetical protein
MRHFGLAVTVILLFSSAVFAQHSSSSGSSSSGSSASSSSSGSSHSSYSGGSSSASYSSGGHSSGSSSASSSSRGSGGSSARGATAGSFQSSSDARSSHLNSESTIHSAEDGKVTSLASAKTDVQPEKRSFVSHLFHPFHKTQPKLARADLRSPVCIKGHCVCSGGQTAGKNGVCGPVPTTARECGSRGYWNGGGCVAFSRFRFNDCAELALLMQQQAQQMGMAESARQTSCSGGVVTQECSELTARSVDEKARYRALRQQYEQCRGLRFSSHYGYSFGNYGSAGLRDPFGID